MKKLATIFLTLFLLVIQTKMIQNIHLCQGHICNVQTFLEQNKSNCCSNTEISCCTTEDDNNCCKDIVIEQDIDDVNFEKFNFQFYPMIKNEMILSFIFEPSIIRKTLAINAFEIQSNAPPLFKLYQQYIFYA